MNPFRVLASFTVAVCLSTFAVIACHDEAGTTTPPSSASHHKMGVNVNNTNEVGTLVAELEIGGVNKAADFQTDGGSTTYATVAEIAVAIIGPGPLNIPLASCILAPNASLTASNTNYGTISIYKRPGGFPDSGPGTVIASTATAIPPASDAGVTNASGNWIAYGNVTIPAVAGAYVSPGDVISYAVTKTGTGVTIPQAKIDCYTNLN